MLTRDTPLDFVPGTKWKCDNSGYIFLGEIFEKVSGEKYADYLQKHIFVQLGMKDSGYDKTSVVLKNRASGYGPGPNGMKNAEYLTGRCRTRRVRITQRCEIFISGTARCIRIKF